MAKLTWLGSEDYREGESPLESCTWNGVLFTAGDKVEVTDEWMVTKAKGNRFFKVDEGEPEKPADPPPELLTPPIGWTLAPEAWTNNPPDYPPEDEPDRPAKRRGRPPRIRDNGD